MATWLTLQRNEKALENPTQPYFRLSQAPEKEDGQWIELGACWKSKSGKEGLYACKIKDNVRLVIEDEDGKAPSAPVALASSFDRLMNMVETSSVDTLMDYVDKIQASSKYTDAQKAQFTKAANDKIDRTAGVDEGNAIQI